LIGWRAQRHEHPAQELLSLDDVIARARARVTATGVRIGTEATVEARDADRR